MTSLVSTIRASIEATSKQTLDGRDIARHIANSPDVPLGSGPGDGKADISFFDTRTLAASTSENLDLSGVLTDAFGQVIAAVKVKAIEVENPEASLSTLTIGAAASNTFLGPFSVATHSIDLKPGDKAVF